MGRKVYRDGRVKLTGADYTAHKMKVWEAQNKRCADCGLYLPWSQAEFHHADGRGMSGSKRNDEDEKNTVIHGWCHALEHYRNRDLAARKP